MESSKDNIYSDMIMEYLMHSCYKNTAKAFQAESKKLNSFNKISSFSNQVTAMDIDQIDNKVIANGHTLGNENAWNLLDARKELYNAIENGEILKAIELIEKRFPGLIQKDDNNNKELESAHRVLFKLKCQQFIEIARKSPEEAVFYAHQYLQSNRLEYKEMVYEVSSLVAYEDPSKSGQAHLLSQDRRRQLADEVNCVVLAYCDMPEYTSIERLQRQYEVVKQELNSIEKMDEKNSYRDKILSTST